MRIIETHFHSSFDLMDYCLGWNCPSNSKEAVTLAAVCCPLRGPSAASSTALPAWCFVVAIAFIFPFEFLN